MQRQRIRIYAGNPSRDGLGRIGVERGKPGRKSLRVAGGNPAGPRGERQGSRPLGCPDLGRSAKREKRQPLGDLLAPFQGAFRSADPDLQIVLDPGRSLVAQKTPRAPFSRRSRAPV